MARNTCPNWHAVPRAKRWGFGRTGNSRMTKIGLTMREAWHEARRRARAMNGAAYLFGRDGRIRTSVRYSKAL